MNLDDDYDSDGNNIVPCPICLNVYCASKDGGECPDEKEFVEWVEDHKTLEKMEKYGGSFVKQLAELARRADPINLQKIKDTWPDYWKQYEEMT